MLDAVLVSLADHGLTPSALAARLTYTGAPEAIQGAVAAGLLGAGSVFLGPTGDTAEFLFDALQAHGAGRPDDDGAAARSRARPSTRAAPRGCACPASATRCTRTRIRARPRLYELAAAEGLLGPHLRLLAVVADGPRGTHRQAPADQRRRRRRRRARRPRRAAGSVRGFVLIARTAGLVAHLAEEAEQPIGMPLWLEVERRSGDA